jgi:hypothetical protein
LTADLRGSLSSPSAVQTTDGRIWFATTLGVAWINPKRVVRNVVPPPVFIESGTQKNSSQEQNQKRAIRGRGLFRATGLARLINCSEFCWIFSIRFIDLGRLTRTTCNSPLA